MPQQPQFARNFGRHAPAGQTQVDQTAVPNGRATVDAQGHIIQPDGTVLIDPTTNQPVVVPQTGIQATSGIPVTNVQQAPQMVPIPQFDQNGMPLVDASGKPVAQMVPAGSPAAMAWQHTQGLGGWGWWGVAAGFVLTAVAAAGGAYAAVHFGRGGRRDYSRRSRSRAAE